MPSAELSDGVTIYHEVHGDGEPLVLLMGTSADHTYWGFQTEAYAARHRTVVFDSRGTGRSSQPKEAAGYTAAVMADDVFRLLRHLGIERAHVSGLSLGAAVAMELALNHPEVVATLQLHGAWAAPDPAFVYTIECMQYPLLLGDREGFTKTAFSWILTAEFLNDDARRQPMLDAVLDNPHPPSVEGILGHIHADLEFDAAARLGDIRVPTLVTAGERDIQVPPRLGRAVADGIDGAEYHLFTGPGSSHLACVERADEFNRLTLDWLARHPLS